MGLTQNDKEFQFCPVCGGGLNSLILKVNELPRLRCSACGFIFYLDPKVVACSIIEFEDKIVLLKRAIQPRKGKWTMPGGYVDRREEVTAAAIRETEEECGLKTGIKDLLGVYSYKGQLPVIIVYITQYLAGELIPGDETLETGLFSEKQTPWNDLAFQSTEDALKDYWERNNN